MKHGVIIGWMSLLFLTALTAIGQPNAPFARYIGSPGNYPPDYRIQRAPGGYYLLHNFVDSTLFVPQLNRIRRDGSVMWCRDLELSGIVSPRAKLLTADSAGITIVGTLQLNGYKNFLLRLDTTGAVQSDKVVDLGGFNEPAALIPRGHVRSLAGYRDFPDSTGRFTYDMTMVRLDSSDHVLSASSVGNDTTDFTLTAATALRNGWTVSVGEAGNRALARFACQLAWWSDRDSLMRFFRVEDGVYLTRLRPVAIAAAGDTALFVACSGSTVAGNEHEVVLMKIDTAGQLRWSKRYYQIAYDLEVRSLAVDVTGRICMAGNCYRSVNDNGTFLLRLDAAGDVVNGSLFRASVFTFGGNAQTDLLAGQDGSWIYPVYYYAGNLYTPALVRTDTGLSSPCTGLDEPFVWATAPANLQLLPLQLPEQRFLNLVADTLSCSLPQRMPNEGDLCLAVGFGSSVVTDTPSWSVYPNPFRDAIRLEGLSGELQFRLYDMTGREVRAIYRSSFVSGDLISLPGLSAGCYRLVVSGQERTVSKTILSVDH
jgi:hypothetical protein